MRNKNILKVLSLLAAVCIAAGCNGSTVAETTTATTTTTAAQTTTTVTTTAETTTSAEVTDSEISGLSELEVDYVDDDGIVYYKNPTEWTYEKFFSELTINGKSIEAPLTLEKLGTDFTLDETTISYNAEQHFCTAELLYKGNLFAQVWFKDVYDINELSNKEIDIILQLVISHTDEECFDILRLNNVGMGSNAEDIKAALGVPYGEADYIILYGNSYFSFKFNENGNTHLILIDLETMKNN